MLTTLAALLGLAAFPALAQQGTLYLVVDSGFEVTEGDSGTTDVNINWSLVGSARRQVSFVVETDAAPDVLSSGAFATADAGVDYLAIAPTQVIAPAGQTSGSVTVQVVGDLDLEKNQRFTVSFRNITGALATDNTRSVDSRVTIIDDDVAIAAPALVVRPDRFLLSDGMRSPGMGPYALDVLRNDTMLESLSDGGSFELLTMPANGTAEVEVRQRFSTPARLIRYSPAAGFYGFDQMSYRTCDRSGRCAQAEVRLEVLPLAAFRLGGLNPSQLINQSSGSQAFSGLSVPLPLTAPRFVTTTLATPVTERLQAGTDPTPSSPWDGDAGVAWRTTTLPPLDDGVPVQMRIEAALAPDRANSDLYLGIDRDGNGRPSPDELMCADVGEAPSCGMHFQHDRDGLSYWVMLHNRVQDTVRATVSTWELPLDGGDGSLVATGPGHVAAGEPFRLRLTWDQDAMRANQSLRGHMQFYSDTGHWLGDVPVRADAPEQIVFLRPMLSGRPRTVEVPANGRLSWLHFDVPHGATRLEVSTDSSDADVDFYLARVPQRSDGNTFIDAAPPSDDAVVQVGRNPRGRESTVIQGAALTPGRWYVVPFNRDDRNAAATIRIDIEATPTAIRPGSYFDPDRPGSGLFLYPAGGDWTGLWYTYDSITFQPTWYYLQAPAPGANGIWTSPIYRAAWNGTSRELTSIGTVTATPAGGDSFFLSYQIYGLVGSRLHVALGRGCPSLAGTTLDISGQWFDPARSGTGYSVQAWTDYEYIAAFIYGRQGEPMFLAAENTRFGGADAVLPLQLLTGYSPTNGPVGEYVGRVDVGTLRRRVVGSTLSTIEIDAIWGERDDERWSTVEQVQILGGMGATQGCQP